MRFESTHVVLAGALTLVVAIAASAVACGSSSGDSQFGDGNGGPGGTSSGQLGGEGGPGSCTPQTCEELGWACGYTVECGKVTNCADEGRSCGSGQVCVGGLNGQPTKCVAGTAGACDVCDAIPACTGAPQKTILRGRVITPGRDDNDTADQVGVPNAIVYIPRSTDPATLPAISTGIPTGGTSCDRCDQENLGPVVGGAVTDATGAFKIEGNVPVGKEFLLVVQAGKFRRVTKQTLPATAACQPTDLPSAAATNPARLPRSTSDGLAVNLPKIAISTGQIDAIECVFEKMGIAHSEFANPGTNGSATPRLHLYRGGTSAGSPAGAKIDSTTPFDATLYGDLSRLEVYDIVVADCEGPTWDAGFPQRNASGANVREYVNRGGRLFASHLSFSWLDGNGTTAYNAATPIATGLDQASSWEASNLDTTSDTGTGEISANRPLKSPHIQNFTDWMGNEKIVTPPSLDFAISQPRSQALLLGPSTEEFVYRVDPGSNGRVQQFSFNTPYAAPPDAACGRVAYSGFHVVAGGGGTSPYGDVTFPSYCAGPLTSQEKVLLYMLFDVSACVGADATAPVCTPETCAAAGASCGFTPDGCGNVLDCGPCTVPK